MTTLILHSPWSLTTPRERRSDNRVTGVEFRAYSSYLFVASLMAVPSRVSREHRVSHLSDLADGGRAAASRRELAREQSVLDLSN